MTHSQRRDVLKAAGTVAVIGGLAGCAEDEEPLEDEEGEAPAEEPEETQEEPEDDVGAFRVAHASPDAPNVDVYFDEQAVIEDLGFREVSPYEEVEPDSYQVQVTAADDPDTVVFDEEVEVQAGVTNTAVAFGEAAGGPEDGFQVEVLEDDITDPGEDTSRVRLFHASPDAEDVDVVVAEAPEDIEEEEAPEEDAPEQTQQEDEPAPDEEPDEEEPAPEDEPAPDEEEEPAEEPQVGEPLFEGIGFGDSETQEIPAGDYTLEVVPTEADEDEEPPEDEEEPPADEEMPEEEEPAPEEDEPEQTQQEEEPAPEDEPAPEEEAPEEEPDEEEPAPEDEQEPVEEFELSTESQTVYSAFAVGYVNPEEAQTEEQEEFEVVTVEDASEGERADGGTEGNGLLSLQH